MSPIERVMAVVVCLMVCGAAVGIGYAIRENSACVDRGGQPTKIGCVRVDSDGLVRMVR